MFRNLKPVHGMLLILAVAVVTASFILAQQYQQATNEDVPPALAKVWEVYQAVKEDYAGVQEFSDQAMVEGAIEGIAGVLKDHDVSVDVPENAFDPTSPGLQGVWDYWRSVEGLLRGKNAEITEDELEEGAVRGLLRGLGNPYTSYLDPQRYTLEEQNLKADFEGIGAWVDEGNGGQVTIVGIIPNTPAERAGIKAGDIILEAGGASLEGKTVNEAVSLIRGPRGTPIDLVIRRQGESQPLSLTVVRELVEEPSVQWSPINGHPEVAYIAIQEFLDKTDVQLKAVLEEVRKQGYRGIVLDVRNNPGGLLTSTVGAVSQFLEEGLVLYHIDAQGNRKDFPVKRGGVALDLPLVVLANQGTASGSEVLVGALQEHERALIIGSQTYGKGSVNELRKLTDGSGLYITAALWYTPEGRLIEGQGLKPDVEAFVRPVTTWDAESGRIQDVYIDYPLERAIEELEKQIAGSLAPAA